jgi:DNA-binding NarL/FixJ family response regulator
MADSRGSPGARAFDACTRHRRVLALVSDLMLSIRLEEPVRAAGHELAVASSLAGLDEALSDQPIDLVLLDLADMTLPLEDALRRLAAQSPRPRVLGFFPHVRKDLEQRAREAGCDLLLPRSRLLLDLPAALRLGFTPTHE